MALTRNFKETVIQRVQSDASFAQALLDEAATLFLNGEPETARLILRDLVNATIGFEQLATLTAKPSKSLHRMLSPTGNPSMDNLAAIFRAVRERLQVSLSARPDSGVLEKTAWGQYANGQTDLQSPGHKNRFPRLAFGQIVEQCAGVLAGNFCF